MRTHRNLPADLRRALAAALALVLSCAGVAVVLQQPHAAAAELSYAVVGATEKVLADQAPPQGSASVQLAAGRNEFVSTQIVVPGGSTGRGGVTVSLATPFTGPASIPASAVTVYREAYHTTSQPSQSGRAVGQWPDALIPTRDTLYGETRNAFPYDVPPGQNLVAFVDVLVPSDQAPGNYSGAFAITSADGSRT